MRRASAVGVLLMLAACSSNAPRDVPPPPAPAPAARVAGSEPATASASGPVAANPGASYRRVVRDGEELFCRREPVTGSRLKSNVVCLTAAQIEERAVRSKAFLRDGAANNPDDPEGASNAPVFGY